MSKNTTPEIFIPGSQVVDKHGEIGTFAGFEQRGELSYARFQFGEMSRLLPRMLAEMRFRPISEQAQVLSRLRESTRKVLQSEIEVYRPHISPSDLEFTNQEIASKELEATFAMCRNGYFVFRGDSRHPKAECAMDKILGKTEGPFDEGFAPAPDLPKDLKPTNEDDGTVTYTASDPSKAISYPILDNMPFDWDRRAFVYIINAEGLLDDPRYFRNVHDTSEFISAHISGRFVHSAIERIVSEHDIRKSEFKRVYYNEKYDPSK